MLIEYFSFQSIACWHGNKFTVLLPDAEDWKLSFYNNVTVYTQLVN